MGDFNIDFKKKGAGFDKLNEMYDPFNLTNSINSETCYTKNHKSLIDLFFTNKPLSFQKTHVTETGLSDYHKLISTFFKSRFSKASPKVIKYRNYKNFDKNNFLSDLNNINVRLDKENPNQCYDLLTNSFLEVANKHAPFKKKTIRGNHASFVNKELRKAIYIRSRLRNKMCQNPISENIYAYKKQRNKCVSLRRQCIKQHLANITKKGITTNKEFWNFIKPFLTNKGFSKNNDITLKIKKEIITDEKNLADLFDSHYINIVEINSGIRPETLSSTCNINGTDGIQHIVNLCKDHPSIKLIKKKIIPDGNKKQEFFSFKPTTVDNVEKLLNETDTKKAVGIDTIPPKLIKMASDFLAPILTTAKQCVSRKRKSCYCCTIR